MAGYVYLTKMLLIVGNLFMVYFYFKYLFIYLFILAL